MLDLNSKNELTALKDEKREELDEMEQKHEVIQETLKREKAYSLTMLSDARREAIEANDRTAAGLGEIVKLRTDLEKINQEVEQLRVSLSNSESEVANFKKLNQINAQWATSMSHQAAAIPAWEQAQKQDERNQLDKCNRLFYETYRVTRNAWYERTRDNLSHGLPAQVLTPVHLAPGNPALSVSPQMLLEIQASGMHAILNSGGLQGSPLHHRGHRDLLSMGIHQSVGGFIPGTPPNVGRVTMDGSQTGNSPARNSTTPATGMDTGLITSEEERLLDSPQRQA